MRISRRLDSPPSTSVIAPIAVILNSSTRRCAFRQTSSTSAGSVRFRTMRLNGGACVAVSTPRTRSHSTPIASNANDRRLTLSPPFMGYRLVLTARCERRSLRARQAGDAPDRVEHLAAQVQLGEGAGGDLCDLVRPRL